MILGCQFRGGVICMAIKGGAVDHRLGDPSATTVDRSVLKFCAARVWHMRTRPFKHPLNYNVFSLRLRMDRPADLAKQTNWLFGFNRKRLVSFMNADHGYRDGGDLNVWLSDTLQVAGVAHPGGAVWLQTFPRMLGYVFNPVSFWYLHDEKDQLRVIVAEVNNTFGQHHHYVLSAPRSHALASSDDGVIHSGQVLSCQKVFHVSPFCPVTGHYRFERVVTPLAGAQHLPGAVRDSMTIDYFDDVSVGDSATGSATGSATEPTTEPIIRTGIAVVPEPFTTARLLKAFLRMPLMTFGVMVRIHWHAFKLWRGGAKFHKLPDLPNQTVTSNTLKTSNQEPSQ